MAEGHQSDIDSQIGLCKAAKAKDSQTGMAAVLGRDYTRFLQLGSTTKVLEGGRGRSKQQQSLNGVVQGGKANGSLSSSGMNWHRQCAWRQSLRFDCDWA